MACTESDEEPEPEETEENNEVWKLSEKGVPQFLIEYVPLEAVNRISKFRSGVGHDYSDDFESCRSMKHYFDVPEGTEVLSPLQGEVIWMQKEWAGYKLAIRSKEYPAFVIEIFHVTLKDILEVGAIVDAGQVLGFHASANTASDIAIMVQTDMDGPNENTLPRSNGIKLLSYFECITEQAFDSYQSNFRTGSLRGDFIISKETRDAESFDCDTDWQFGNERPEYWIEGN